LPTEAIAAGAHVLRARTQSNDFQMLAAHMTRRLELTQISEM
jgi:hypothetical protein